MLCFAVSLIAIELIGGESAMKKQITWLVIGCLLVAVSGCSGQKADQPVASPTVQSQQATPAPTTTNLATTLPQQPVTGQAKINTAPVPQSQGPVPVKERQFNSVASMLLYAKVNIPVLMPSYWPPIPVSNSQNPYCGLQYSAGSDSYSVNITVVPKPLPVSSPELNMPPNDAEANQWGNFGGVRIGAPGVVVPNAGVVQKPPDGQPSVIGGYQGWQDQFSFYWGSGPWQCEVLSQIGSPMDGARSLTGSFQEAGELKGLRAKSGKILWDGRHTFISWVSADGRYEYNLQYDGEIADAIKIANSFSEVKKE